MKKILFLLAMLPMMLFNACSSDEPSDKELSVISSGRWTITNDGNDDYINATDKEANWLGIDHERGTITFYMEPYLGTVMTVWEMPFRVEGSSIYIETDYYTHKIVFSDVKSNTARAIVYYDNREPFRIYLRKDK